MRKTLGVCITGYDRLNEIQILDGICKRCSELDIGLLVFFNSVIRPPLNAEYKLNEKTVTGEMQVYKLINYDLIDAMAVFGGSILEEDTFFDIVKNCKERGIPLLNIDDLSHEVCRRVLLTDGNAMERVVDHLIEVHGCMDICFMNGFKDNPQSDSRLNAYKDSLEKHGIAFEEKNVYYGCFWRQSYDEAKRMIAERGNDLPDALVCANDTMALYSLDAIKESGLEVPKDIIVTGFDDVPDGAQCLPSLTTVRRGLIEAGRKTVDALLEMINGGEDTDDIFVSAVPVFRQSCGCEPIRKDKDISYDERIFGETFMREFNQYILNIHNNFSNSDSSEDMFRLLSRGTELLNIKELYACISAEIEHKKAGYNADEDPKGLTYVPEKMVSMFMHGHDIPVGTEFYTKSLLPGNRLQSEKNFAYMFAPLYFKDSFLGYMALGMDALIPDGDMFSTWLMTICNNAGSYYMNNELQEALAELQVLYLHDPLTGIYNRRGMNKLESGFVQNSIRDGKKVAIVCADVDGLKVINDNYGHEEGDNAIVQCTHAIQVAFPLDSICVRTGGDEFMVIAAFPKPEDVDRAIADVDRNIDEYNKVSGKPYMIGCSCGYCIIPSDIAADLNLEPTKKKADLAMYNEKLRRKTIRR